MKAGILSKKTFVNRAISIVSRVSSSGIILDSGGDWWSSQRRPLGGVEMAQATLDRLRADSAVSRRPSTLVVAGEGEA